MPVHRQIIASHRRENTVTRLSGSLALLRALSPASVSAQQGTLEEIIVTAQKREQNMMDVPVALTAVSANDLKVFGIQDTAGLTKISPSLSYDQTGLAQNSGFRIRGIGTVVYSVSAESAVSVVIDDVATTQSGMTSDTVSPATTMTWKAG